MGGGIIICTDGETEVQWKYLAGPQTKHYFSDSTILADGSEICMGWGGESVDRSLSDGLPNSLWTKLDLLVSLPKSPGPHLLLLGVAAILNDVGKGHSELGRGGWIDIC